MYPFIRFGTQIIKDSFKPKIHIQTPIKQKMRVLANDLDHQFKMRSSRLFVMTDFGRMRLIVLTGLFPILKQNKWFPINGSCLTKEFGHLKCFEHYFLTTQLCSWDEKWFYVDHEFYNTKGELIYYLLARTTFVKKKQIISPDTIFKALNMPQKVKKNEEMIKRWSEADQGFFNRTKR